MPVKKIKITCEGTDYVDYKILKPLQGNLKILSDKNLEKLKKSIIKYGFTVPAFIWKSGKILYSIDCHQRVKALDSLFSDGYEIPDIPIVYIKAKDKKDAKEKLLHITSSYGEFTQDGFADFMLDARLDISELEIRLSEGEFDISETLLDYATANKEIDVESFDDEMELKLIYSMNEYMVIIKKLNSMSGTYSEIIKGLLLND